MGYARGTGVSSDKSKNEIEATLRRYGASEFMYGWATGGIVIGFRVARRTIRMVVPMPGVQEFTMTPAGRQRHGRGAAEKACEEEHRRRWRALLLVIKAKLEAVESGIATLENEFLPYTVLANGQTMAEWVAPQMQALSSGDMPPLLPSGN